MRARFLILTGLLLAACEDDAAKLERLKTNAAMQRLGVLYWERTVEGKDGRAPIAGMQDSLRAAETRRDLAERELNKFMNGR